MIELIKRLLIRFLEWLVSNRPTPRGSSYDLNDLAGSAQDEKNENNDRQFRDDDPPHED